MAGDLLRSLEGEKMSAGQNDELGTGQSPRQATGGHRWHEPIGSARDHGRRNTDLPKASFEPGLSAKGLAAR